MSLSDVRPFFKARAKALGYQEHPEAFSEESLARVSGKRAFIKLGQPQTQRADQNSASFTMPVSVDLYVGQGLDSIALEAKAFDAAEEFLKDVMSHRYNVTGVAGVLARSITVEPLNQTNDKAPIARVEFTAIVAVGF